MYYKSVFYFFRCLRRYEKYNNFSALLRSYREILIFILYTNIKCAVARVKFGNCIPCEPWTKNVPWHTSQPPPVLTIFPYQRTGHLVTPLVSKSVKLCLHPVEPLIFNCIVCEETVLITFFWLQKKVQPFKMFLWKYIQHDSFTIFLYVYIS